jgi:ankyrin repeat protein
MVKEIMRNKQKLVHLMARFYALLFLTLPLLVSCAGKVERVTAPFKNMPAAAIEKAVRKADVREIKALLDKNPRLARVRDSSGYSPLHWAAIDGHREVVELLLDRGAEVNGRTTFGNTPLHLASRAGRLEAAKLLIDRGADIHASTNTGITPLSEATTSGHADIANLLRSCGARN